jgi:hypothetical protein
LLLGHSKGGVDAAAALSLYWPDLKDKVAGLVLAQSPYGGTPIASDLLREGQLGDYVNLRKLTEIVICKVIKVCSICVLSPVHSFLFTLEMCVPFHFFLIWSFLLSFEYKSTRIFTHVCFFFCRNSASIFAGPSAFTRLNTLHNLMLLEGISNVFMNYNIVVLSGWFHIGM